MNNQRHHSIRNQSPIGDSRLRNRKVEFGNDAYMMPRMRRSLSPVPRRNNDLFERREEYGLDFRGRGGGGRIMSSRSPPIERKMVNYGNRSRSPPKMVNYGNRSRSPMRKMTYYGNRSRSPPGERMRKMINCGNRSRSPPIDQLRKMPSYRNRSTSPPIEQMRKMTNYGNRSSSPGIQHMRKMPSYRNRSRSPPIDRMRKMPHYENRSRSPPIDQLRKIPNYGIRSRSRSPPMEQMRKMANYGEDVLRKDLSLAELHRRHDPFEYMDMRSDGNAGLNNTSRVMREGFDRRLGAEPMKLEDGTSRGLYRMPADMRRPSENIESAGDISLTSMRMGLDRFKDERIQYPGPLLSEKYSGDREEKPRFHTNDTTFTMVPPPQSMELTGPSQFRDFGSTSSRSTRDNFPTPHWHGPPLTKDPPLSKDEYFTGSAKLAEHMGYDDYRGRRVLDSGRNPEGERKELSINKKEVFSPSRGDRHNYLYSRTTLGDIDGLDIGRDPKAGTNTFSPSRINPQSYLYPKPGIEGTNDHPSVEMYGRSERIEYGSGPNMLDPVRQLHDTTEFSRRKITNDSVWEYPSPEKQSITNHIGMSRSSVASQKYMDTVIAQGRKVPREEEIPYFDDLNDHDRMLPMTSNCNHARDAGPIYYKEQMRSPEFHPETSFHRHPEERIRSLEVYHDREMHRHPVKIQGTEGEEDSTFDPSHRAVKRRGHTLDEELHWSDSREIPRNWNSSNRLQYQNNRGEDWTHQHTRSSYSSKRVAYDREVDRRSRRFSDRTDTRKLSAYGDRSSSYEREEYMLERSIKGQRSGGRCLKGHLKNGSASHCDSYQYNRKNMFPKPQNVWMRSKDENKVDVRNEVSHLENRETFRKSEPSEDSEEFKQLVHNHYLSFTKKLNDNFAVRRRYKEQGGAGSLFCLVCGRSESKEFTDTRRLATHAYMSHKVGSRTQHLGFHKAICVLLGWKSEVAPNVVTWSPETISSAEALAQKEDLIIWPPVVVIHNSPPSDHGTTVEALEVFIKGKGVTGGKVKMAKHNRMVVKFLGTYSGVQDAEKLHKYFVENKRGRVDFEKITSSKHKTSKIAAGKKPEEKLEETEVYGYMGIAEDLDQVDFDTKKKCSIRSKKEIQDIVDAPVKLA